MNLDSWEKQFSCFVNNPVNLVTNDSVYLTPEETNVLITMYADSEIVLSAKEHIKELKKKRDDIRTRQQIKEEEKVVTQPDNSKDSSQEISISTLKGHRGNIFGKLGIVSDVNEYCKGKVHEKSKSHILLELLRERFKIEPSQRIGLVNNETDRLWQEIFTKTEEDLSRIGLVLEEDLKKDLAGYRGNIPIDSYEDRIRIENRFIFRIKLRTEGYIVLLQRCPDGEIECLTRKDELGDQSSKKISEETTYEFPSNNMIRRADYDGEHQLWAAVMPENIFQELEKIRADRAILEEDYLKKLKSHTSSADIEKLCMSYFVYR
jgi:hypothetical protein